MDDKRIIELYFRRSDQAIEETASKYGRYCYSIRSISRRFGYSESKVKSMLYRTREKLKNSLQKEGFRKKTSAISMWAGMVALIGLLP